MPSILLLLAALSPASVLATPLEGPQDLLSSTVDGASVGAALAFVDLNGDGVDDLLIGAPDAPGLAGEEGAGAVWFVPGGGPLPSALQAGGGVLELRGALPGGALGWSVAGVGDIDGDGFEDAAVGAPAADAGDPTGSPGQVFLLLGGPSGPNSTGDSLIPDAILEGPAGQGGFGWALGGPGDADGDGFGDLLIGAPGAAPAGERGSAWLIYGRDAFPSGAIDALDAVAPLDGEGLGDRAGSSLTWIGDRDGDGGDDLAIGAPGWPGGEARGRIYLLSGRPPMSDRWSAASLAPGDDAIASYASGTTPGSWLGASLASGNADADPELEIFAAAAADPSTQAAGAGVFLLGPAPFDPASPGEADALGLGAGGAGVDLGGCGGDPLAPPTLLLPGDLDGDGLGDLLVGLPRGGACAAAGPRVDLYPGLATWSGLRTGADAEESWTSTEDSSGAGRALAMGDRGVNSAPDLAVGAPGASGGGAVFLVHPGAAAGDDDDSAAGDDDDSTAGDDDDDSAGDDDDSTAGDDDDDSAGAARSCEPCGSYGWLCGVAGPGEPPVFSAALLMILLLGLGRRRGVGGV